MTGEARRPAAAPAATPAGAADPPIRDAAAVILLRRAADGTPQVLMGQRGAEAAFMPSKFVFPGGAVDAADLAHAPALALEPETERRLLLHADPAVARALALTAVRELWEETGLALGRADPAAAALADGAPPGLRGLLARGVVPEGRGLRFVFRAVTPRGRPRRFDARFFLADAGGLVGDPDDFAAADTELAHLQWLDLAAARALALPFITEVVLSEVEAIVAAGAAAPRPVPFFHHDAAGSHFRLI